MTTFSITTLGCKVNQHESDSISEFLVNNGFEISENADICIINTCAVTGKASMQSRQAIRKVIRENPHARIIVTGCTAQVELNELLTIKGIDDIIPHDDKQKIPEIILTENNRFSVMKIEKPKREFLKNTCQATIFREMPLTSPGKRTRPFLKIQDGCNSFCSYCIVPYTRGRSRSMPPERVLSAIREMGEKGYLEIVLTGIHLGYYGLDLSPKTSLYHLLRKIIAEKAIPRIRLSSIEPGEVSEDLIRLVADSDMLCDHFHIPLQNGDDSILKRMNRPYDTALFEECVLNIRKYLPDAAIGTDIMTGFPGEGETEFQNTYNFLDKLPLSYFHVFPFSPRKGTEAFSFKDQVPPSISKERSKQLRLLGNAKKLAFYKGFIGKELDVLIENNRDHHTNYLKGLSGNYIKVFAEGPDSMKNTIQTTGIQKQYDNHSVFGHIL